MELIQLYRDRRTDDLWIVAQDVSGNILKAKQLPYGSSLQGILTREFEATMWDTLLFVAEGQKGHFQNITQHYLVLCVLRKEHV